MISYKCVQVNETFTQCLQYVLVEDYSDYKLTNEQMITYIVAICMLYATVTVFKVIKRHYL